MDTIHVVSADDSQDFARICGLLDKEDDIKVVAESADGQAAVELAGADRPEIVTMDSEMPVMDGIGATREIPSLWAEVRGVPLTGRHSARPWWRRGVGVCAAGGRARRADRGHSGRRLGWGESGSRRRPGWPRPLNKMGLPFTAIPKFAPWFLGPKRSAMTN